MSSERNRLVGSAEEACAWRPAGWCATRTRPRLLMTSSARELVASRKASERNRQPDDRDIDAPRKAQMADNSSSQHPQAFSSDAPATAAAEDRFNRYPFAEAIGRAIRALPSGANMVIGLHGPWGEGKTSVLNFIRETLKGDDGPAVVSFNPWRFSDEAGILTGFFETIATAINARLATKREDVCKTIAQYARYVAPLDKRLGDAQQLMEVGARASVEQLRERLVAALADETRRIVVLIDDIDRLDKHEIQTLFRLVKACADFPNVVYVLAFDDGVVAKALSERYGSQERDGRAFLEKIIQVPLKLPLAAREDLRKMCFEGVDTALASIDTELSQEEVGRFVQVFGEGVEVRLTTPRLAKRYGNALCFALPGLRGEVNIVDLLLVEALRVFFPGVYNVVRSNQGDFCGVEREQRGSSSGEPRAVLQLDPVLTRLGTDEQESVKALLGNLFPRLSGAYRKMHYGPDWLEGWATEKRACSPSYCSRYFTYAIAPNDVPDRDIEELQRIAEQSPHGLCEMAAKLLTPQRAARVIEKLRRKAEAFPPDAAERLATCLAPLGATLPKRRAVLAFAEPPAQCAILISELLARIPGGVQRKAAALRVVQLADRVWFASECAHWMYVTDDESKLDRNTLAKEEMVDIDNAVADRIADAASGGVEMLADEGAQPIRLLFDWYRARGKEPVEKYLLGAFAKDPRAVSVFLRAAAPATWVSGSATARVGDIDARVVEGLEKLIDIDRLAELVEEHCPGDFKKPEWSRSTKKPVDARLAQQFICVYRQRKDSGEKPKEPPELKE